MNVIFFMRIQGYSTTKSVFRVYEMRILRRFIERLLRKRKEQHIPRSKGENNIHKHFKLTEETARILEEQSKAENMNESEYIRYLLLHQSEHPRSRELELEVMRLRNEINKIGVNVNQIAKNSNSHMYSEGDKINLIQNMEEIIILFKAFVDTWIVT